MVGAWVALGVFSLALALSLLRATGQGWDHFDRDDDCDGEG